MVGGGAVLGLLIALVTSWLAQRDAPELNEATFRTVVLISLVPAVLGILSLVIGARDVQGTERRERLEISFRRLGRRMMLFKDR
jgi:ABC-type Fe3+ transport system permease subunit